MFLAWRSNLLNLIQARHGIPHSRAFFKLESCEFKLKLVSGGEAWTNQKWQAFKNQRQGLHKEPKNSYLLLTFETNLGKLKNADMLSF